jgi:fatty aldehyde decarbonylase
MTRGGIMDTLGICNSTVLSDEQQSVWTDILAQAVTGELIGAMNYRTLAAICDDAEEKAEAYDHARREAEHARMFGRLGEAIGAKVRPDVEAPYWARIRGAFMRCAEAGNRTGCFVIQEVMLESFAVASYSRIALKAPARIAVTFAAIAAEERAHVDHAVRLLRVTRDHDPVRFDATVRALHAEVMTTLAEMVAREDPKGHCGLCQGTCVKEALPSVGLCTSDLRGASLRQYMQTLDAIGIPGDATLQWVAQLPV